jgi:hypothetical protein
VTANLPAVRDTTAPMPRISDDSGPVIHVTYPELDPTALDATWYGHGDTGDLAVLPHNQQVYRALETIVDALRYPWKPAAQTARRAAVVLLATPMLDGTPLRCHTCGRVYTAGGTGQPIDWGLAGREDGACYDCTNTPGADKTITITPAQAAQARRRRTTRKAS